MAAPATWMLQQYILCRDDMMKELEKGHCIHPAVAQFREKTVQQQHQQKFEATTY